MIELILSGLSFLIAFFLIFFLIFFWFRTKSVRVFFEEIGPYFGQLPSLEKNFINFLSDFKHFDEYFKNEIARQRKESNEIYLRYQDSILKRITEIAQFEKNQLDTFSKQLFELTKTNENKIQHLTDQIDKRLGQLREDNNQKLEKMRATVDEKLQQTLETRLQQSFNNVNLMLERMQKNLGEMTKLSQGMDSLNRVLSNVKTRGMMGEYQLENILEQILTTEQYGKNVMIDPQKNQRVEFAIKLPGKEEGRVIWLPIDCKFPIESYQILLEAYDKSDWERHKQAKKNLETMIRNSAKEIQVKYIQPPYSTDFAILFLPIEGLYAEVIRETTLVDEIQRNHKIIIVGPTNFSALLNSLQVGFRTLAVEKHSSEVWNLLNEFKKQFNHFGSLVEKSKKKIQEAGNIMDETGLRARVIEKKLRKIEVLPSDSKSSKEVMLDKAGGDEIQDDQLRMIKDGD